ncbi:MAG: hypothetical protein ACR2QK_11100 [Acidimicrobiales bacterium]
MKNDPEMVLAELRKMVAEEMFLLGQELEDSLDGKQQQRLTSLATSLDEATDLLSLHRKSQHIIEPG